MATLILMAKKSEMVIALLAPENSSPLPTLRQRLPSKYLRMLFAKKSPAAAPSETAIAVSTIPLDFYGGANPVVKFKTVEKEVDLGKKSMVLSPTDKKLLDKSTASGSGQALHPTTLFSN